MINVLLDPLPTGYEDEESGKFYPLAFDFRVGIQISLIQTDTDLDELEKIVLTQDLIFTGERPDNPEVIKDCVNFYINGWYHDNQVEDRHKNIRKSDFDVDQWRIYAAFLSQYQIDLNTIEDMHFWVFMGLLNNLNECSYTRVVEIRTKKLPKGLKGEELQQFQDAKRAYKLGGVMTKEEAEQLDSVRSTLYKAKGNARRTYIDEYGEEVEVSEEEQKRIEIFESYADK